MSRSQIFPSIETDLKKKLLTEAATRGVNYGEIIEALLKDHYDPDSKEIKETILFRRLDRLSNKLENVGLEMSVIGEALLIFVRTYLGRLPDIPEEQKESVKARAERKFDDFLQILNNSLGKGNHILSSLPKDEMGLEELQAFQEYLEEEEGMEADEPA